MASETPTTVPADHLMTVYNRAPLAFERGEGVRLYTAEGEAYLDCLAGIAVNALGHAHPTLVARRSGTRPTSCGTPQTSSAFRGRRRWPRR